MAITGKKISVVADKLTDVVKHLEKFSETEKKTHMTKATTIIEKVIKDLNVMSDASDAKKSKAPKKLNDYMVFAQKIRPEVVKRLGPVPVTEVAKEIGRLWQEKKAAAAK